MESEELNECHHCGEEFSSAADFKVHLKTHETTPAPSQSGIDVTDNSRKTHECFHCGEGFDSVSGLDNHIKTHDTSKNQTVVSPPSDDTAGFVDLTEDGDDPHECFHCGEEFDTEDLLNSHLMVRHQVKPYHCTQCGQGFMHEYQVKAHELVHKDVSPKVLSDVEMMYKSYSNNTRATSSTHDDEDAASILKTENECTECGKCFKTASALGTHKLTHNVKVVHKCTYCGKTFSRPSDLRRHVVTHTGEKAHSCHLCPKKFAQTSALYSHLRQAHRSKPFVCSTCGEGFEMMADLKAHEKTHKNKDDSYVVPRKKPHLSQETDEGDLYKCQQCGDSFTEKTALNIHSQIHMRDTIEITPQGHNCPRCSMMFDSEAELNRHIMVCVPSAEDVSVHVKQENNDVSNLNVNNDDFVDLTLDDDDDDDDDDEEVDRYKCAHCNESFRLEVELNAHLIMLHSTPDTHECFHCGEEFDTEDELKLHILRSHKVKTPLKHHKCPDCDMTFLLLSDFENHKEQRHPQCKICDQKFPRKKSLEFHMRVMHDNGTYLCAHCKEPFQTGALLKTHMETQHPKQSASPDKISGKVWSHKCLQCDQSFTSKAQLYKHCETHLDTKPRPEVHKCYCGMKFSDADDLERHKVTHEDVVDLTFDEDETYKCSFCDDVYSREEELIVHMMMHPKQEPFECGECGKKFVFEKDYRFHLRTHVKAESSKKSLLTDTENKFQSGDKPHQCPVCQKRFASLAVLQRHETTHGSEPHKCHLCGAGFWHVHVLQRHLEKDCSKAKNGKPPGASFSSLVSPGPKAKSPFINSPSPTSMNGSKVQQAPAGILPREIVPQEIAPVKKEVFTCCGWSFMSEDDMKLHELSHKVTVYKCVQCKQVFRSIADLETHMKTHAKVTSLHKVPSQDYSSSSSTHTTPSTSYIEDGHHKCLQCRKEFRTAGFLNKHMQLHKSQLNKADKVHRCNECGQKFLSLAGLTRHALAHNDKKPNQCPVCNENFNNSAKLFEHMATHDGRNSHTCKQCGQTFKRLTSLKSHMRTHTEEDKDGVDDDPSENVEMLDTQEPNVLSPNIREPNGARPKSSTIDLTDVKEEEEEEDYQGYMCTYCGRKFDKEKNLKVHFRTHMKSTSTTYYETKVKFSDAAGKELRIVTRLRKKRCKCYLCFKMFRRPSDLARHMMIHTGERPCKCNFCPAGFIQISHLKLHTLKFHKDIPPRAEGESLKHKEETAKARLSKKAKNVSNVTKFGRLPGWLCCGLRFTSSLEIQHHWLVHNEEEAYPCPHCDLKFTKGFSRTKHIMSKHSGAKPNCLDCGKEFATFQNLKAHMKVHEAQLEQTVPDAPSTNRVEVYTDVADSEPASTSRAEVYTDVADASSVLVKTEVIPDNDEEDPDATPPLPKLHNILHTAPDPLLLKKEGGQNSDLDVDHEEEPVSLKREAMIDTDTEVDIEGEVDPIALKKEARTDTDAEVESDVEVDPIALKKEAVMDTTDDPSSPIDDAVLDSEPEEHSTSLKKKDKLDTDAASPKSDVGPDTEAGPSAISIVDVLPTVPVLLNQYRCLHCGDKFSEREHLIPHISKHTSRNYSSCNACKMGFLRKEELKVHLATHFMYPS